MAYLLKSDYIARKTLVQQTVAVPNVLKTDLLPLQESVLSLGSSSKKINNLYTRRVVSDSLLSTNPTLTMSNALRLSDQDDSSNVVLSAKNNTLSIGGGSNGSEDITQSGYGTSLGYLKIFVGSTPYLVPLMNLYFWPFIGGVDNTNSRQSPIVGPQTGNMSVLAATSNTYVVATDPVVGSDGTIYVGVNQQDLNIEYTQEPGITNFTQGYVYAYNPNGTVKWTYELEPSDCFIFSQNPYNFDSQSLTIDKDGVLYFGSFLGNVYAVDNLGQNKWVKSFLPDSVSVVGSVTSTVVLGDQQVFFCVNCFFGQYGCIVYSVNQIDGTVDWMESYISYVSNFQLNGGVTLDKSDNVYFVVFNTLTSRSTLHSFTSNHNLRYSVIFDVMNFVYTRIIFSVDETTLYFILNDESYNARIVLMDTSNGVRQSDYVFPLNDKVFTRNVGLSPNNMARTKDNTLYILTYDTNLNMLHLYGIKNRTVVLKHPISSSLQIRYVSEIIVGGDGTVYCMVGYVDTDATITFETYAVAPNGTLSGQKKWSAPFDNATDLTTVYSGMAMDMSGNLVASSVHNSTTNAALNYSTLVRFNVPT